MLWKNAKTSSVDMQPQNVLKDLYMTHLLMKAEILK